MKKQIRSVALLIAPSWHWECSLKTSCFCVALFAVTSLFLAAEAPKAPAAGKGKIPENIRITFVELGSMNCVPCRMMQPVMKSVEEKYAGKVKVVFHDVWTPEGKPFAKTHAIRLIPTQVFLDENGVEFYRHEGFFSFEEMAKMLDARLAKP